MYLTEIADYFAFIADVGLSARMQVCLIAVRCIVNFLLHAGFFEEFFYNTLHIKEITSSVHTKSKVCPFIRKLSQRKCLRQINFTDLIQTNTFVSSVVVCCQRRQHTMQCGRTHDTVIFTKRITDRNNFTKITVLRNAKFIKYLRAFERIRHSFGESTVFCDISCHILNAEFERKFTCGSFSIWKCGRDLVISEESCNFLCYVCHAVDILTESRRYDLVCLRIQCQFNFCKVCKHFFFCKVCSEKCIDAFRLKRHSGRLSYFIADVYAATNDLTSTQFFHKLAGTVDCCFGIVRVKTFFEFTGCIGTKSDSL